MGLLAAALIVLSVWGLSGGSKSQPAAAPTPSATGHASPDPTPAPAPVGTATSIPKISPVVCPKATLTVHNAAQLQTALSAARAGQVINVADGIYVGHFTAKARATPAEPIYLCGSRKAVLDGGGTDSGYVLHLDGVAYWRVSGFTVRNGQKGVVADHTSASIIDSLDVGQLGDEGIHLRSITTDTAVQNNVVHDTGLHSDKFGEGIYVGSAKSNWCTYSACNPDRSDGNLVVGNTISHTTAENLDIKEGTTAGTVTRNQFDSVGMTASDSWVDVKGNGWRIADNSGVSSGASSIIDGYQTHEILPGWGAGNAFAGNTGALVATGFAFHLTPASTNQVGCDNRISGVSQGLANVACVSNPTINTTFNAASPTSKRRHRHRDQTPSPTP